MDFLTWWFDTHYILSTITMPFWSFLWCMWTGNYGWRPSLLFLWYLGWVVLWVWAQWWRVMSR